MCACICCGYKFPLGVGTGLAIPSAVTPTITNLPAKSGMLSAPSYSISVNLLLKRIYAVPFGCVTIGWYPLTAISCMPISFVLTM